MHADAISTLRAEWAARSRSAGADGLLARLTTAEPVLAALGAADLAGMFASLDRPRPSGPKHWEVVTALIRQLDADELVGLGLVTALAPGLLSVARRLEWGRDGAWRDRHEFATDLVSETWLVLRDLAGTTVAYPERTVLDRVRRRMAHQRARHQSASRREAPTQDATLAASLDAPAESAAAWSGPQRETTLDSLAAALRGAEGPALRRDDVRLVFETRVLGYSIAELAERGEGCRRTLEHRRGRAEALLCA